MKKEPDQVREEVKEALPELQKKAQRTLDRLERIPNWVGKVGQLEQHMQEKLRPSIDFIKDIVAECLRPYAQFTRPGVQAGAEQIYEGIGFANHSVVQKGSSWADMITRSIAKAAWPFRKDKEQLTFDTLWPRVENDLTEKGIIEI
jgi:hypothetical protein